MSAPTAESPEARFRGLALSFPDAFEASHMGSADFRIHNRIFATLAFVAKGLGTLKLKPEQQAAFLADAPEYFTPAPGGWGRMGMTLIQLDAPEAIISGSLATAYKNVESTPPAKKRAPAKPRRSLQ